MRQKAARLMAFDPSTPDRAAQRAPQVPRCRHTVELPRARGQGMPSGRTSRPALQATDLLATLPACSGRRHNQLCRRHHECKLGDQTRDDADKEPREEPSCGRSQTSLYNSVRTHRSLNKDAPMFRSIQQIGIIRSHPILGGLHHHYVRI